jgi:hypothetical protein
MVLLSVTLTACGGGNGGTSDPPVNTTNSNNAPAQTNEVTATPDKPKESPATEVAYELGYVGAKTWENSIGTVWVQVIFEVKNTGTADLYLSSGACDLEDASGSLVAAKKMISVYPDTIAPGESAIYYEETTLDDFSAGTALTVIPRPDVAKAKHEVIRLPVSDTKLQEEQYFGLKLIGRVENNTSDVMDGMTYVSAVLRDADGLPLGVMFTIIMDDIAVGDKVGFECSGLSLPDGVTLESVASFDVAAYPLQMQFQF